VLTHSVFRTFCRQCVLATFVAISPIQAWAQAGDTLARRLLSPGVEYLQFADKTGPWRINLVRINLRVARVDFQHVRASDSLRGREKPSDMVKRLSEAGTTVLAALNADFFDLRSGENENNQVVGGEWWKGLKVTESPFDTYENMHVQFGVDRDRHLLMDRFILDGKFWARGAMTPIVTVNAGTTGTTEGTTLFTNRYGARTPADTIRKPSEIVLMPAGVRADTQLYVRRGPVSATSGTAIPPSGAVLAAHGPRAAALQATQEGDTIKVWLGTQPRIPHGATPSLLIGGWPRILHNGVSVALDAATIEGTISRNAEARHPRSAVGFSRDSSRVFLLTVDGRAESSVGITLVELAALMRKLGAWQAMNFDGGGSTAMVIDGKLANVPSDPAGERAVGNALLLVKRK
jgi:Phosphodiester glycosidase